MKSHDYFFMGVKDGMAGTYDVLLREGPVLEVLLLVKKK